MENALFWINHSVQEKCDLWALNLTYRDLKPYIWRVYPNFASIGYAEVVDK
jgi:hypothetical protein